MKTIKELINKIKYDPSENPDDYEFFYHDRILNKYIKFKFNDIKGMSENFILIGDKEIPLHRIRQVKKKGKVIWQR